MKKKVAFICVHNSCRSQMAEALGKLYENDVFESYSGQKFKLLNDIPKADVVIKMGCNVVCPYLPANHIEDWGIR